ncbi:hypothetical protein BDY21DRAFT_123690 [Lineolata rhizophorae]|uniref:Fungal N-terminal domain-containing protein n=1 Tax=Lineolata rhizophorae TaxID=578093 RepID=A0A6A6NPQ8_9PEZI|nr:hypothetical protein BDY21DRAFT_123690 [Lineolata rhizophorae]
MDPISVVGIAGSSVQFADVGCRALLGTLKFLKSLRDIPRRMETLLQDIDKFVLRISGLQSEIRRPDSTLFSQISAAQRQRLEVVVQDAYQTVEDLQTALIPLGRHTTPGSHTKVKKAWRAVMSVKEEDKIKEMLERIERLYRDVTVELQRTGLDAQAAMSTCLLQIQADLGAHGQSEIDHFDQLRSLIEDMQRQTRESSDNLSEVKAQARSAAATVNECDTSIKALVPSVERIENTAKFLHEDVKEIRAQQPDNSHLLVQLQATYRQEAGVTREEFQSLRNAVLLSLSERSNTFSDSDRAAAGRLSDADNFSLTAAVGKELVSHPGTLKESCDFVYSHAYPIYQFGQVSERPCNCVARRRRDWTRRGRFAVVYQSRATHDQQCPFYEMTGWSWSYRFSAQLLPFLRKTVELTLGAGSGGRSPGLTSSLRFYGTVKRSESPIFQAFDSIPKLCASKTYAEYSRFHFVDDRGTFVYKWDCTRVKEELSGLCQRLWDILTSGSASASDKDENGNTALHGILFLVSMLGGEYRHVVPELDQLILLVVEAGVDVSAVAYVHDHRWVTTCTRLVRIGTYSYPVRAADLGGALALEGSQLQDRLSEALERCNILEPGTLAEHSILPYGARFPCSSRRQYLALFKRRPSALEWYGYGPLEHAIIIRSRQEVQRILQKMQQHNAADNARWLHARHPAYDFDFSFPRCRKCKSNNFNDEDDGDESDYDDGSGRYDDYCNASESNDIFQRLRNLLSPLECALGWPDGLQALLDAGMDSRLALNLAIDMGDLESLEILLSADFPLTTNGSAVWDLLSHALSYASPEIRLCVVNSLKDRRNRLTDLALRELTAEEQAEVGLPIERTLDANAFGVYNTLRKKGVKVPDALYPSRMSSVYDMDLQCCNVELLDMLFEAGFQDVEVMNTFGETPVTFCFTNLGDIYFGRGWTKLVRKFLDKMSNLAFNFPFSYPNMLFYLASLEPWMRRRRLHPWYEDDRSELQGLVQDSASLCDPLEPDTCLCFCSSNGCTPVHMFRYDLSDLWVVKAAAKTYMEDVAAEWVELCGLDSSQSEFCYRELCRLETFDRLGMAHTCCGSQRFHSHGIIRNMMHDSKRVEIQAEDSELNEQLELLLAAYDGARQKEGGEFGHFWSRWWRRVDQILPEPLAEERIRYRGLDWEDSVYNSQAHQEADAKATQRRAEREAQAVEWCGYSGMDFIDIIRKHFADVLDADQGEYHASEPESAQGCETVWTSPGSTAYPAPVREKDAPGRERGVLAGSDATDCPGRSGQPRKLRRVKSW